MAIRGTHSPASSPVLVRAIAANAPASTAAELRVKVPSMGNALTAAYAWVPKPSGLPAVGSECLLAYDEHRQPWVIAWR